MIINYFKVMLRNMSRSSSYTIINVSGLALGITCAMVIFLYTYDEFTYDHNHTNIDKIYRLNGGWKSATDESSTMYPRTDFIAAEYFKKDFQEVDVMTRIQISGLAIEKPGTQEVINESVFMADDEAFRIFTFPFLHGGSGKPLPNERSMILTRKMAMKYFNRTDVVGETLHAFGRDTTQWTITGVMEDYPDNTHLRWEILTHLPERSQIEEDWFYYRYLVFFTLKENATIESVESRVQYFARPYAASVEKEIGFIQENSITPLARVRLYSHLDGENNPKASTIYIFAIIGTFILIMACINFMNLATARSMKRAKEIGVRKVIGARKSQLVAQFLGEAFVITFFSAALSVGAIYLLLPAVNIFSGKNIILFTNPVFWTGLVLVTSLVSIVSGSYPSVVLSGINPAETLKGGLLSGGSRNIVRKGLVVFQFVVSISLIAGTLIVMNHLSYLRTKELGFDKDQVILIQRAGQVTKERITNIAGVKAASFSNKVPGMLNTGRTIINGWDERDPQVVMDQVVVDYDFIELYKLQLLAGRGFDKDIPSDMIDAFLINEAALSKLGYKSAAEAIGGELWLNEDWGGKKGRIIGVLKDFHFNGVNNPILPFSMFMSPQATRQLSVKVESSQLQEILPKLEEAFKATVPDRAYEYSFLDQQFDRQYQAEDRFMAIFSFFAFVGIAIGCLGLYGLALFMAEQRTKEIGIRKVFGSSVVGILSLLATDFVKLVVVAFVIAIPTSYFGMEQWLSSFPYREKINPLLFVVTALIVMCIVLITVGYQSIRAAMKNPVSSLRFE
jgi:putative ABC transport system permease protein